MRTKITSSEARHSCAFLILSSLWAAPDLCVLTFRWFANAFDTLFPLCRAGQSFIMSTPPVDPPLPPAPSRASRLASLRQTLAAGRPSLSPLTLGSGGSAISAARRGGLGDGGTSGGECFSLSSSVRFQKGESPFFSTQPLQNIYPYFEEQSVTFLQYRVVGSGLSRNR